MSELKTKNIDELVQVCKDTLESIDDNLEDYTEPYCDLFCEFDADSLIENYLDNNQCESNQDIIQDIIDTKRLDNDQLADLISEACDYELIHDICTYWREVASVNLGEIEVSIEHELLFNYNLGPKIIDQIKDELKKEYCVHGDSIYLNYDHSRWIMRVDEEKLSDALENLLKNDSVPLKEKKLIQTKIEVDLSQFDNVLLFRR